MDYSAMANERDIKRRSSSRSIKRRKFDDELVEYSLGLPAGANLSKFGRIRTQSQSLSISETLIPQTTIPVSAAPIQHTEIPRKRPTNKSSSAGTAPVSNRGRKRKGGQISLTKDLGRWKPTDDLALVLNVLQTNDFRQIHRAIKFSCRFTIQEIQQRWYALLYDQTISRVALAAMRNLHPELFNSIQTKTLYSKKEEVLLGTIKSTDSPTIEVFEDLLLSNPTIFITTRTAKSLMTHWQLLKSYQLLPDQANVYKQSDQILTFLELDEIVKMGMKSSNLAGTSQPQEEWMEHELQHVDRIAKTEIRYLEESIDRLKVMVDSFSHKRVMDFDKKTLGVLRGRQVRFLVISTEVTFGRVTKDNYVDIDLTLEGPVWKVSRKQGVIKLLDNGDFYISCEGRRPIYVDGRPVMAGSKHRLTDNCVIEIASLKFTFLINQNLISQIREAVDLNTSQ